MGFDVQNMLQARQIELESLARQFQVTRLELFGSANTPDFDPERSDLDFLVEFAPDADLGPWLGRFFELREALSALFGHPVDLVMMDALGKPRFRQEAEATRQVVYAV